MGCNQSKDDVAKRSSRQSRSEGSSSPPTAEQDFGDIVGGLHRCPQSPSSTRNLHHQEGKEGAQELDGSLKVTSAHDGLVAARPGTPQIFSDQSVRGDSFATATASYGTTGTATSTTMCLTFSAAFVSTESSGLNLNPSKERKHLLLTAADLDGEDEEEEEDDSEGQQRHQHGGGGDDDGDDDVSLDHDKWATPGPQRISENPFVFPHFAQQALPAVANQTPSPVATANSLVEPKQEEEEVFHRDEEHNDDLNVTLAPACDDDDGIVDAVTFNRLAAAAALPPHSSGSPTEAVDTTTTPSPSSLPLTRFNLTRLIIQGEDPEGQTPPTVSTTEGALGFLDEDASEEEAIEIARNLEQEMSALFTEGFVRYNRIVYESELPRLCSEGRSSPSATATPSRSLTAAVSGSSYTNKRRAPGTSKKDQQHHQQTTLDDNQHAFEQFQCIPLHASDM